jgi:hypothetical protein
MKDAGVVGAWRGKPKIHSGMKLAFGNKENKK